jgi:hypothetical protein
MPVVSGKPEVDRTAKAKAALTAAMGDKAHDPAHNHHSVGASDTFYDHEGRLAKKSIRVGNMENEEHDRALER